MNAAPIAVEENLVPRTDAGDVWSALVGATATWTAISPHVFRNLDWQRLIEAAGYHGVLPIVSQRVLESSLAPTLAPEIRDQLRRRFQTNLMRSLPLVNEVLRVVEGFEGAGVPIIPYKGPALAEQLWGNAALRVCDDLDFLVEKQNVEQAGEILGRLGYERVAPVARHLGSALLRNASEEQFRHRETGLLLELQWSPAPRVFAVRHDADALWKRRRVAAFSGRLVLGPSPEELLLLLSIHGWKHNWSRLIWLGDVAQLIRANDFDWDRIFAQCRSLRNVRLLGLALRMVNHVFDVSIPRPFQFFDPELDVLVDELVDRMSSTDACDYRDWHRCMLAARDSRFDRVRQLASFLFTPGLGEYATCKLPRWATAGYRAVRVGRLLFNASAKCAD